MSGPAGIDISETPDTQIETVKPPNYESNLPDDQQTEILKNITVTEKANGGGKNAKNVKICFNGIVKNEQDVMRRRLDNIRHLVDAIAITDTGSTDNTIEIIESFGREFNIPTRVDVAKFVNFEVSRNDALRNAEKFVQTIPGTWYLMFGDADDLNFGGNSTDVQKLSTDKRPLFPEIDKTTMDADLYQVDMVSGETKYPYTWMIKLVAGRLYEWDMPIHEAILVRSDTSKKAIKWGKFTEGYVESRREGSRTKNDTQKYEDDAKALEKYIKRTKCNYPRGLFYLAQSYRDSKQFVHAFDNYKKRTKIGGDIGEVYNSYKELFVIGLTYLDLEEDELVYYANRGMNIDPRRLEIPYYLLKYYNKTLVYPFSDKEKLEDLREANLHLQKQLELLKKNPKHTLVGRQPKVFDSGMKMYNMSWIIAQAFLDKTIKAEFLFANKLVYDHLFYIQAYVCAYQAGDLVRSKELAIKAMNSPTIDSETKDVIARELSKFYANVK
jgi:tetratricopeptide (TPR) repeat protein